MPKRGRHNNRVWTNDSDNRGPRDSRHDGGKYYYEHDERGSDFTRRVSFKAGTNNRVGKQRRGNHTDWDSQLQSRLGTLTDDDVDMNGAGFSAKNPRRFNPYTGGRGRGRGGGHGRQNSPTPNAQRRQPLIESPTGWYKVTIPHGQKYDKEFITSELRNVIAQVSVTLTPFVYKVVGSEASFYVDSHECAVALANADRQVTAADGFKVLTRVRPGFPNIEPDAPMKERMKLAMSARYNVVNKALDLERFHRDPSLVDDLFCALFRPQIVLAAIDIIAENIPELVALNLNHNQLHSIDHLSALATKLPALTVLHIAKNRIRDIRQLDALKDLKLVDLALEGNPLCDKFKEHSTYVSEVVKRFPKLRKLDGQELPPPILFDTGEEDAQIPPYNGSFLISQDGRDFLRQFLEQYMRIYDADSRQPLLEAYHDQATFSMACCNTPFTHAHPRLEFYLPFSRNLVRVKDSVRRGKMMMQGKSAIVNFLADMPKTLHDALSFAVDMPIYSPHLIQINVSGLFREREVRNEPIRSFSRVFVIVPVGSGFCIVNETLFITNPSDQQLKSAFKVMPAPQALPSATPAQPDAAIKSQMVQALREQTRMNLTWANKCLEETNWNYDLAVVSFAELNKVKAVPPEAFVG